MELSDLCATEERWMCISRVSTAIVSHTMLAASSVYYHAKHRPDCRPVTHSVTLYARMVISIVLGVIPLAALLVYYINGEVHVSVADLIVLVFQSLPWLLHHLYLMRLRRLPDVHVRGHAGVVVSATFVIMQAVVQLRGSIEHFIHHRQGVMDYVSITVNVFHVLYLLSLIPSKRTLHVNLILNVQESSTGEERQSLLPSSSSDEHLQRQDISDAGASFVSRLLFWWVVPLLKRGSRSTLADERDMLLLPDRLSVLKNEQVFHKLLYDEATLHKAFGYEYYAIGVIRLVSLMLSFAGPLILNRLVTYMMDTSEPVWHGYMYAAILFWCSLISSLCEIHFDFKCQVIHMKMRSALITAVYGSVMSAESALSVTRAAGQTINAMSTDVDRMLGFLFAFHFLWSLPIQLIVSMSLLYQQLGVSSLSGVVVMVLMTPVNKYIASRIAKLSELMMKHKDSRIRVMTELLNGIRVIKMHSWETFFYDKINVLRGLELKALKAIKYIDALCVYFWATTPMLISVSTFTSYVLLGNQLSAAKVFTSIALFDMLIYPLNALPWVINGLMEARVSLFRVQALLNSPRVAVNKFYTEASNTKDSNTKDSKTEDSETQDSTITKDTDESVTIKGGEFTWFDPLKCVDDDTEQNEDKVQSKDADQSSSIKIQVEGSDNSSDSTKDSTNGLHNIDLCIKKNAFIGVVGRVGSGKTSLLNTFLSEMKHVDGSIKCDDAMSLNNGGFGLTTQEAWLQNTTIRENILFGSEYNSQRYQKVVYSCDLIEDLNILPSGDQTQVGEKGVTLSGGQKARIALARAIYQDKAIYLLDDPLAAVDTHVARHLMEKCIAGPDALLANKTRILCTHHTRWLRGADLVIRMSKGKVIATGTPAEILTGDELADVDHSSNKGSDTDDLRVEEKKTKEFTPSSVDSSGDNIEEKESGVVNIRVYKAYWVSVGVLLAPLILLSLLFAEVSVVSSDLWLSYWVSKVPKAIPPINATHLVYMFLPQQSYLQMSRMSGTLSGNHTPSDAPIDYTFYYLGVYASIIGANTLFTLARAFLFAYGGIRAAVNVHRLLLRRILRAPISFFDITPVGRILNRFSADLYSIDDSLPFIVNILMAAVFGLMGSLAVTIYGLPWIIVLIVPLSVIYYKIQNFYRKTSREVKRVQSVTMSPIYSHFSESMAGLLIIRSMRNTQRFRQENRDKISTNQRAVFSGQATSCWLNVCLQFIAVVMVTCIALLAVFERSYRVVNPGLVGIALTYAISMSWSLSACVNTFAETEKYMVAMERADDYVHNVPVESDQSTRVPPPDWPQKGVITFNNVSLKYRKNLPRALKNVDLKINAGEKIGIVGRTGSGKSSLFQCLLRIVDPLLSGTIHIDNINIADISLHALRSKVAIIPQDPFLFVDTIRMNLDPHNNYTDSEVIEVIMHCDLHELNGDFTNLETILDATKLSVGERQLFCLARTLLDKSEILLIDEATASVDSLTDQRLQKVIAELFQQRTVLTIAHRIHTVLHCDRVLVMGDGNIIELDTPASLLADSSSVFSGLVKGDKI